MLGFLATAVIAALHVSAETSITSVDTNHEPSGGVSGAVLVVLAILILMLLITVALYVKYYSPSKAGPSAELATEPVFMQASPLEAKFSMPDISTATLKSTPIVEIEVERKAPESETDAVPPEQKAMFASNLPDVLSKPRRSLVSDQIMAAESSDLIDSRKSSGESERSFRKFRLHSLSDGDLCLHIVDANTYDDLASPRS